MKENLLVKKYYKTVGHKSRYDQLSLRELFLKNLKLVYNLRNNSKTIQSVHNYYARKLKIPSVKLEKTADISSMGSFEIISTKKDEDNTKIKIDDFVECAEGVCSSISTAIHETKHAHQAYLFHKFSAYGIVPNSDWEKVLLLYKIFVAEGCGFDNWIYYAIPEELDAFIFEFNETQRLMEKYPYFNNESMVNLRKSYIFKMFYALKYNKEGCKNKEINKTIKNIKRNIYCALNGDFGEDVQCQVKKIVGEKFNVSAAFNFVIDNLNKYADEIILDQYKAEELGMKLNLAKNGNLIYGNGQTSIHNKGINSNSRYGKFLKRVYYRDQKEFEELSLLAK